MKIANNIACVLLGGIVVGPTYEAASWQLKTYGYETSTVKYSIFGEGLKEHQGYYFPEYLPADQVLHIGFKPIRFQKISTLAEALGVKNERIYAWKTEFEFPIECLNQITFLYRRIYARNVSEYTIYLQSSRTEQWYRKRIKIPFNGYQIPSYDAISRWEQLINDSHREQSWFLNESNKSNKIGQLVIVVTSADTDFDFVIGDLQIDENNDGLILEAIQDFFS